MTALTQIGQVPSTTESALRRLLNHLVNSPDLWITGGTLSVQTSGSRKGKIDLDITDASAGQVLTLSGDPLAPAWVTPASDPVTLAGAVTDVFSITAQELSAVDNGADAIVGWDESANKLTYLPAADIRAVLNVENGATADQTQADINALGITTVGTISTGTWQGTAITDTHIASAATWNAKQDALAFGIANTNAVKIDDADAADDDYAKFTASGLEGQSYSEVKTDLSIQNISDKGVVIGGAKNITPGDGSAVHVSSTTLTDTATAASGTADLFTSVSVEAPTLAASNSNVTTTNAATLYVKAAPTAGTEQTITNAYALWVDDGTSRFDGPIETASTVDGRDVSVDGAKLDGIAAGANNYTLPEATAAAKGGIKLFSNTDQSVAANSVTTTASRTYGIQLNSGGQAVVNVPWTDTQQSTDVTLVTSSHNYLSLSGQEITLGQIDIGDDTNLQAGTNITLVNDTLNVDDAFLKNDADDTTTGTITAGGFTTTGNTFAASSASAGTPGSILTVSGRDTSADGTSRSIGGGDLVLAAGQSVGVQLTTTLAANIAANNTVEITVADSAGFPAATGSDSSTYFDVSINREIVTVTNVSGTTWTIVRSQRKTTAPDTTPSHSSGSTVTHLSGSVRLQTASYADSAGTELNGLSDALIATPDGKVGIQVDPGVMPEGVEAGALTLQGTPATTDRYILGMADAYVAQNGHQSGAVFTVNTSPASSISTTIAGTGISAGGTLMSVASTTGFPVIPTPNPTGISFFVKLSSETTLASNLATGATTLNVASTLGFPFDPNLQEANKFYIQIGDEILQVTDFNNSTPTQWTVVRAQLGTSDPGSDHLSGAAVTEPDPECVEVTAWGSPTTDWTIVRGQHGTTAVQRDNGATVSLESNASTFGMFMDCGTGTGATPHLFNNEALVGGKFTVRHRGTGRVARAQSGSFALANDSTGTITEGMGVAIDRISKTNVTTGYGIWQHYFGDINYLNGNLGCGVDDPDTQLHVDGVITLDEQASTPANPTADTQARIYVKDDKLIVQWLDGSQIRYKYLPLAGTSATWVAAESDPT